MPLDAKYGRVTLENQGSIGDDEPVVVFRARDRLLPDLLNAYRGMSESAGSSGFHTRMITQRAEEIHDWQKEHDDIVRTPQSAGWEQRTTMG